MIIGKHSIDFSASHTQQKQRIEQEQLQLHQVSADGSGRVLDSEASSDGRSLRGKAQALAGKLGNDGDSVTISRQASELSLQRNAMASASIIVPLSERGAGGPTLQLPTGNAITPTPVGQLNANGAANGTAVPANVDPQVRLAAAIISAMTGKAIELVDATTLEASVEANPLAAPAGEVATGMRYEHSVQYSESEHTLFSAQGSIQTADGRSIQVDLMMEMSRHYSSSESTVITAGAQLKDPLVINFDAPAVSLSNEKFLFDLDADGSEESINMLNSGSGLLVLDRNGDGKANDGSELFGALSGNGFADLARYDEDGNRFIDEGDAIFSELKIWVKTQSGDDQYFSLADKGVGAIYLGSVSTPFELKNSENQLQGVVRSSGLYLSESGKAGSVQQIDLVI